jgi:hypothetical protein
MGISFIAREIHSDPNSASLGVLEFRHLPFQPKRAYWLSDFKAGSSRGNHAHKSLNQVIVLLQGNLDLIIHNGTKRQEFQLNEKSDYVLIPSGHWREMKNASNGTVLLVLADSDYDEQDYIRSWPDYLHWYAKVYDER